MSRIFPRAKRRAEARALSVHSPLEYLEGTQLDRLLNGLPDKELAAKIKRAAIPVEHANAVPPITIAPSPLHAVIYATTCSNCGAHGETFGFLSRKITTEIRGIPTTRYETVARPGPSEYPLTIETQNVVIPFCPVCLDEEMRNGTA
jgi:hypothetical protein